MLAKPKAADRHHTAVFGDLPWTRRHPGIRESGVTAGVRKVSTAPRHLPWLMGRVQRPPCQRHIRLFTFRYRTG